MPVKKKRIASHAPGVQRRGPEGAAASLAFVARIEVVAGLLLTLCLVGLHVTFLTHAGGLWRDEVQIFNLSTMPTFAEQWQLNEHDTFPLLWQLTLRGWSAAGLASTDMGIRLLGFLVGLGVVGMLWYCARQFEASPLVSLAIFGLSPMVILFGDSVRGYGFGMLWLLFMIARLWRVARDPGLRNIIWAGVAVLLAVQSFYFSVIFFAVLWFLLMAVLLSRRDWRPMIAMMGIGVVAAVSMLPYLTVVRRQLRWVSVVVSDVNIQQLVERFQAAVNSSGDISSWIWIALLALTAGGCIFKARRSGSSADRSRLLFPAGMIVAGPTVYMLFLLWRRHGTHVWYYIAIMGFLAIAIDAGLAALVENRVWLRLARLGLVAVIAVAFTQSAWPVVHTRMTNLDRVAATLGAEAKKGDLILIIPWWPGVTFARYYQGEASWVTLPDLGPLRVQRFDLVQEKLFEKEPIKPILDRVTQTLQSGHRLWIVGGLPSLKQGEIPAPLPPPPDGPLQEPPHLEAWAKQVSYLVQSHATKGNLVPVELNQPVNLYENYAVFVVEGWR